MRLYTSMNPEAFGGRLPAQVRIQLLAPHLRAPFAADRDPGAAVNGLRNKCHIEKPAALTIEAAASLAKAILTAAAGGR